MLFAVGSFVYFGMKLAVYTLWCKTGLGWLTTHNTEWKRSIVFAMMRVAIGITLGFALVTIFQLLFRSPNRLGLPIVPYLLSLTLLRWLEWSFISGMMLKFLPATNLLLGFSLKDRLWRGGGILISFLTDASMIAAVGLLGFMPC